MIEIKNLVKKYEAATPINGLNLTINNGDIISIIGPSGTGKSTLLRLINGLEKPNSGEIFIDGVDVLKKENADYQHQKVSMVFQQFNLFGHMTVLENIMKPQVDVLKVDKQKAYDTAIEYLKVVNLLQFKNSYPQELSGGQKQRIAIARTLALHPEVILFDEPTSALDPKMVDEVLRVIKDISNKDTTMLIVTHEMNFAKEISNRIIFLNDGGVYEQGTPKEIFEHPQKEKTKHFIFRIVEEEIKIDSKDFDFIHCLTIINDFVLRNGFGKNISNKLQVLFEEMVAIGFKDYYQKGETINVVFSYLKEKDNLRMTIKHHTAFKYNDLDIVSRNIIKSNCKSVEEKIDEIIVRISL